MQDDATTQQRTLKDNSQGTPTKSGPVLEIQVREESQKEPNAILSFREGRLNESKKHPAEGKTYFGSDPVQDVTHDQTCDFVIPGEDRGIGKRHFVLAYSKEGGYSLQDLGEGLGTFVKITEPFPVTNRGLFFFGPIQCATRVGENSYPTVPAA